MVSKAQIAARRPFATLSARSRAERIRVVLGSEWGLENVRLHLVSEAYNTTFRVDCDKRRFALRVNTASSHPESKVLAEIAFVQHLATAQTFKVAVPISKLDGSFVSTLSDSEIEDPVFAVLYEWLPHRTVGDEPTAEIMFSLGRATSELHVLARDFLGAFPVLTEPYYGDQYRLDAAHVDLALFEECADRVREVFAVLAQTPKIPLHVDLHLHNIKFGQGQLSVFDFDDAMISWPIMDPAITMWYYRSELHDPRFEASFWQGFGTSPAEHGLTFAQFETLVAARTLLLVNDVIRPGNPTSPEKKLDFIRQAEANLRAYVSTGEFRPKMR